MPDWAWWLILTVALLAGEVLIFTAFILGPLSLASGAAAVAAALGAPIEVQLAIFAIGGTAAILLLRPIAVKHLDTPQELRTNVDAYTGKRARVLRAMDDDSPGLVRIGTEDWTASPAPGVESIAEGEQVKVVEIKGATAIVEPWEG